MLLAGDVAGVVMLVTMTILRLFGPKPVSYGIRAAAARRRCWLANAYTAHILLPEAESLRREINGPMASVAATDPRRVRFDSLHNLSTMIVTAMALAGIAVAAWEARE